MPIKRKNTGSDTIADDYLNGTPISYTRTLESAGGRDYPFIDSYDAPKTTTLTYTYHKTVMGVDITFTDTLTITAPHLSLDLDADNDGQISPRHTEAGILENRYKLYAPGKILPLDGHGVADHVDELAEIHLNHPSAPGTLTFDAPATNFVFYADTNRVTRLTPPCAWNLATETPPPHIYADAVTNGTSRLTLTYTLPSGVALTNTAHLTAIPTISYAPGQAGNAVIWAPLKNHNGNSNSGNDIGWDDGDVLESILDQQGFDNVVWIEDPTGDSDTSFGNCTYENYVGVATNGVVCVITHGNPGISYAVYAEYTSAGALAVTNWIAGTQGIKVEPIYPIQNNPNWNQGGYAAAVYPEWFRSNWKQKLDQNNAITVWAHCFSAYTNTMHQQIMSTYFPPNYSTNLISISEAAGGRWRIGYGLPVDVTESIFVIRNIFENMSGFQSSGNFRTAGEAYTNTLPRAC